MRPAKLGGTARSPRPSDEWRFCLCGGTAMAKAERKADHGDEKVYALRHSTAHVMAGAVMELFPEAKFGFGPPVADGFYYDFDLRRALTNEDLPRIEERMRAMVKRDVPFEHREMAVPEALEFFRERHQDYKVDQIEKLDEEVEDGSVSIYKHADFVDLCRGPHLERTGKIGAFRLLSVAGAYWRGNERNTQLQRIYGTVWPTEKELDDYLERLKEIERRDHRALGRDLELFRIDEELGSGLVLWLPNLSIVREELETWWRKVHRERGYTLVYTPHIAHEKIYQRSGPLEKYGENMYGPLLLDDWAGEPGGQRPPARFWIKPMNCPGHIKVFQSKIHSYRELPLRIGELGTVYRYERGGTLHGMLRVRGFTQDDSHIFCSWDQAQEEIGKVFDLALEFLSVFGYTAPSIYLSTRPEKRLGSDELWDKAEGALRTALGVREVPYKVDEGGGVFYAREIAKKLRAEDYRVHLDEQAGDLRNRVKEAQQRKASYMLVVGDKEAAGGTVSVRRRGSREEERGVALDTFIDRIKKERQSKALPADFSQHEPSAGDSIA